MAHTDPNPSYLSTSQVARYLSVSDDTVLAMIKRRELYALRVGYHFKIPVTELQNYVMRLALAAPNKAAFQRALRPSSRVQVSVR